MLDVILWSSAAGRIAIHHDRAGREGASRNRTPQTVGLEARRMTRGAVRSLEVEATVRDGCVESEETIAMRADGR